MRIGLAATTQSLMLILALAAPMRTMAQSHCKLGRATDLPFDIVHDHPVVSVTINGVAAKMRFGTGTSRTLLTSEGVGRLGLPAPRATSAETHGIGGTRELSILEQVPFKIGAVTGRDLHVFVIDGEKVLRGNAVDGILGMDLLSQMDIDIDVPEGKIILYRALGGCEKPAAALDAPLYLLPMQQRADQRRVIVDVTVGGQAMRALLDTGSVHNFLFRQAARRLGLDEASMAGDPAAQDYGLGPLIVAVRRHIIEPVTVGDLTVRNMPVDVASLESPGHFDMILGMDFFTRVHVWLSFSSHTLIMQFPPRPSPAAP